MDYIYDTSSRTRDKVWAGIAILGFLAGLAGGITFAKEYVEKSSMLEVVKEIRNEAQHLNSMIGDNFHCIEHVANGTADFEVGKPK